MRSRTAGFITWPLWTLGVTFIGARFLFSNVLNKPSLAPSIFSDGALGLAAGSFLTVALVLAWKRPGNPIGWMLLAAGLLFALAEVAAHYAFYTLYTRPGALAGGALVVWVNRWTIPLALGMVSGIVLLFPTGRTISSRWRWVGWGTAAAIIGVALSWAFRPEISLTMRRDELITNPFGISGTQAALVFLQGVFYMFFLVFTAAATVSLALRYRKSSGDERQQLKWFFYGASLFVVAAIGRVVLRLAGTTMPNTFNYLTITFIPLAVGVAILKYHLYAIDPVIKRTMVYVPLTAILAGVYIAGIGVAKALFSTLTGQTSDAAVAFTTLAVVALFTPLKNSLQGLVDRLFKEAHDPTRDLGAFLQQVRTVVQVLNKEQVAQQLLGKLVAAMDAKGGAISLENNGRKALLCTSGTWDGLAVLTLPLEQNGVPLGVISIGPCRQERSYSAEDRDLLQASSNVLAKALALAR